MPTRDRSKQRGGRTARTGPRSSRAVTWLGLLLVFAAAVTIFFLGFHSIIEEDFWWHVKVGADILAGEGIPHTDHYSYPSAGRPYVDLHWLFQVGLSLIYRLGGEPGVIWVKSLLALGVFGILYRLARRRLPRPASALLVASGALLASERILARPEIMTFLFLAVTLWLLQKHEEEKPWACWVLPLVTLVWVNIEGLFVLGLLAICAHLAGRIRDRKLASALGLSILASLANPYFLTGALHPFVLFTRINGSQQVYARTIGEFLSPFDRSVPHPAVTLFPYYLGLIGLSLLLYARRPKVRELILLGAFGYLAFAARRNLPLLAIGSIPILARWIGEGMKRDWIASLSHRFKPRAQTLLATGAIVASILALVTYDLALVNGAVYNAAGTNRRFGTAPAPVAFPKGAVTFLRNHEVSGPIFNILSAGGYLIYAYPEEKVFIDGRLEVHSTEHYARYLRMLIGGTTWRQAEDAFHFGCLVINYAEAMPLTLERLQDERWEPIYLDEMAIVLVKKLPEHQDLIQEYEITRDLLKERYPAFQDSDLDTIPEPANRYFFGGILHNEPLPWSRIYLGQFLGVLGLPELAAYQYFKAVEASPQIPAPRLLLADALQDAGSVKAAVRVLEKTAQLHLSRSERASLTDRLAALR